MALSFSTLSDAEARRRFRVEIERDFSVTAPAGVGKTHALVERIATLAERQPWRLPGLVVITYTKKAANSLRERVYERLQQSGDGIRALLKQSFFGTIHSFCWQLIQKFEDTPYELLKDDAEVRERFLASLNLEEPDFARFRHLFRFLDVDELLEAVLDTDFWTENNEKTSDTAAFKTEPDRSQPNASPSSSPERTYPKQPQAIETTKSNVHPHSNIRETVYSRTNGGGCVLEPSEIFAYQPKRKDPRVIANIEATKKILRQWLSVYQNTQRPLELPACEKGGRDFIDIFHETFRPFYRQLHAEAAACGRLLKQRYAEFRRKHGYLIYDDYIAFAQRVLETDEAKAFYGKKPLYILLDEAQDTDRAQFRFLQTLMALHPHNRFSMVGDPQQSIYGTRADVRDYLELHQSLVRSKRCEELVFSETFRCPPKVVFELNARFPKIFQDPKQVRYVPLHSSVAGDGCVKEIEVPYDGEEEKVAKEDAVAFEARVLSDFLTAYLEQKPRNLSDICILSPRNDWLRELKGALEAFGWKLQLHSEQTTGRDNALFCNTLAALHCINFPQDTFEEAGLLRETFGCSDEGLAYVFNPDRVRHANDAESLKGDCSEESGRSTSATDDLFGRQSSYVSERQASFAMTADAHGEVTLGNVLQFPLNPQTTEDIKAAQDVRRRWRQMLKEISEQSLCAGTARLIEFFKAYVSPMPTDVYFKEILLETAFQTQQLGQSWLMLEQRLRAHLNEKAETEEEIQSDALQGFSCHKAKGLEWKTVVIPFFDRAVRYQTPHYPCVYRGQILWNKMDAETSEIADDRRRELQRLLYVACTRTKEDLFFIRDAVLWKSEAACPSWGALYDAGNV